MIPNRGHALPLRPARQEHLARLFGLLADAQTEVELPAEAWERQVALPWLVRLSFEVPAEMLPALPVEEREFIMETREWFEQFQAQRLKQAEERGQLQVMARICGTRLDRPLSEAENATLASLIARIGVDRVTQAVVSFSPEALAAWLADPNAE